MVYWLLWGVGHVLVRLLYRVAYSGGENVPRTGPVLICANHLAWWDPVVLAIACRRRIHFMAKAELFEGWSFPLGLLLRAVGAYPVRRGTPDRKALSRTLELLEEGKAVGIFPEGTRSPSGRFRRAQAGVGMVALKSGAPVVPAYLDGPYAFRKPLTLTIGQPVTIQAPPDDGLTGGERRQAVADEIMARIAALGGRSDDYPSPEGEGARGKRGPGLPKTAISPGRQ